MIPPGWEMTKYDKLEQRIRSKPIPRNIKDAEMSVFLAHNGFALRKFRRGSHKIWTAPGVEGITISEKNGAIPTYQIKKAIEAIDRLKVNRDEKQ